MSTETISTDFDKSARSTGFQSTRLPVTRSLTPVYALSFLIALLVLVAATGGLLGRGSVYPMEEVMLSFFPVDLFHLAVGLPVLLGAMWLAWQDRLIGLLCWPGALLYVLYSYITNLIGVPFGVLFLPYVLLVSLSAYTTVALVASIDGEAVRRQLEGVVPVSAAAAVLLGLTSFFVVVNVSTIVSALTAQPPATPEHPVYVLIADFTAAIPACLAGGWLLWRRAALGYVAGAGLLLFYSMLLIGLLPVLVFPAFYDGSPVDVAGIVLMLGCGAICLFLLTRFAKGVLSGERRIRDGK